MKALILAAGRGSRMGVLTEDQPKGFTEIAGKRLLDWQIQALKEGGAQEIAIVTGYLKEVFEEYGLKTFHNPRWAETNMVMSLYEAREWLSTSDCLISYSDIVYHPDTVRSLINNQVGDLQITYDEDWLSLWQLRLDDVLSDAESFRIENQKLTEIGEKAKSIEEIQGQYMGLLKFKPEGWKVCEDFIQSYDERDRLHMTGLLQNLLSQGQEVYGVPINGRWCEVDSEEDLNAYIEALKDPNWSHDWRF